MLVMEFAKLIIDVFLVSSSNFLKCGTGIRESVMYIRGSSPGDLTNSAISGSVVGALLCNLKG